MAARNGRPPKRFMLSERSTTYTNREPVPETPNSVTVAWDPAVAAPRPRPPGPAAGTPASRPVASISAAGEPVWGWGLGVEVNSANTPAKSIGGVKSGGTEADGGCSETGDSA